MYFSKLNFCEIFNLHRRPIIAFCNFMKNLRKKQQFLITCYANTIVCMGMLYALSLRRSRFSYSYGCAGKYERINDKKYNLLISVSEECQRLRLTRVRKCVRCSLSLKWEITTCIMETKIKLNLIIIFEQCKPNGRRIENLIIIEWQSPGKPIIRHV